ncbi:hypothetical protein [Acinetobacter calcoaceticus]|uniref:hypothetical protein n=1 Tax=Acinetobacter calcoaceticus TaxID=471 RepID=UPI001D19406F|nr:hypothetical protein [Acinetobacter calcoaceticus]
MTNKTDKVKLDFAKRLHKAMDIAGYPIRGRARILSQEFKISDKGAGKWLNGEAIPETSKIPVLANLLNVTTEWLLYEDFIDDYQELGKNIENKESIYRDLINELENLYINGKLNIEIMKTIHQNLKLMTK